MRADRQPCITRNFRNLLVWRSTDTVLYANFTQGIAALGGQKTYRDYQYPRYYSTWPYWLVPGDTATFTYDALGHVLTANNSAAHVTRTYYQNGLDSTETQAVATYAGGDFTKHLYTLKYFYDLDSRRTVLKYPDQLVGAADSVIRMYDYTSGNLSSVYDLTHKLYQFAFDSLDQLTQISIPGHISDVFHYSLDGQLLTDSVLNLSSSPYRYSAATLRGTTLTRDALGRILSSVNQSGPQDHRGMAYSGLGHLALSADSSYDRIVDSFAQQWRLGESINYDPLGNQLSNTRTTSNIPWLDSATFSQTGESYIYAHDGSGRLVRRVSNAVDDSLKYNAAGEVEFEYSLPVGGHWKHDRVSYYGADDRLHAVDDRTAHVANGLLDGFAQYAFDDYRYDAFGRRVLARSRRYCDMSREFADRWSCLISFVRRTIWDGTRELVEIQMPGGDTSTTAPLMSAAAIEQDTGYATPQPEDASVGCCYDPNPFFGRVAYTYGVSLDEPISILRSGYFEDSIPGPVPDSAHHFAPFTISPLWDSRGVVDVGTFGDGGATVCEPTGSTVRCVRQLIWIYGLSSYRQTLYSRWSWLGTLIDDKAESSGLLYRRNRYLDPATGRFAAEDPLGFAGGLNAYGFANGDPVTYSDPFGLCPPTDKDYSTCVRGSAEWKLGANRTQSGVDHTDVGGVVDYGGTNVSFAVPIIGGYTFSVGRYKDAHGTGWYFTHGATKGIGFSYGGEFGESTSKGAFDDKSKGGCIGYLVGGLCFTTNDSGITWGASFGGGSKAGVWTEDTRTQLGPQKPEP